MSREFDRRLSALERATSPNRTRYIVSDRMPGDGNDEHAPVAPMTEAEWVARHCIGDQHWSDCAVFNEPALPVGECNCGGLKPDRRSKP